MSRKTLLAALIGLITLVGCEQKTPAPPTTQSLAIPATNELVANNIADINGVDLSRWQGSVDFAKIKDAGKSYVFIKTTQGSQDVDPDYSRNIMNARAAGMAAGSYHFYMTDDKPDAQFANFAKHVSLQAGDLPPVVDIEVLSRNSLPNTADELKTFLSLLQNKYGVKPILYSGESFANEYLNGFADYPLWLAEYNKDKTPQLPLDWKQWTFWQHTQNGRVAGVEGNVDLNRYNGTQAQFRNLLLH